MTEERHTFRQYECARCGLLTQRRNLKVKTNWVPVSRTGGGDFKVYDHAPGSYFSKGAPSRTVRRTSKTNYEAVQVLVCRRCPGSFSLFAVIGNSIGGLFKLIFWIAKWAIIIVLVGGAIFLLIGASVLFVDWLKTHGHQQVAPAAHHAHKAHGQESP